MSEFLQIMTISFQRNIFFIDITIYFLILQVYTSEVIIVSERQTALLPCLASLTVKRTHAKPTLLRWFHSRYHKPIYTLDVRLTNQLSAATKQLSTEQNHSTNQLTAELIYTTNQLSGELNQSPSGLSDGLNQSSIGAKHFPSHEFEGRLYLEQHSLPLLLRVDPVQFEDSGRLTCRIDFKARRSVYSSVELQVVVPPKEVTLRDESGHKLGGVIGPFNLGQTIIITCGARGGKPSPVLDWSGTFDNSSGEFKLNVTQNSTSILIPCLKRAYQWTHYTCTARNSNITVPKSKTVTLEINLPPHTVTIQPNHQTPLQEGQQLTLSCSSNGSHPKAHILWCMNGRPVASKEVITDAGTIVTSYHSRRVSRSDNGKRLECVVTNPSIPGFIVRREYSVEVYYKPEVRTSLSENTNNTVVEGNAVLIQCEVKSNPKFHQKQWFFEGQNVNLNANFQLSESGDLFIGKINHSLAGVYTCKVTNSLGSSSSSIFVNVKYPPVCQQIEMSAKHLDREDSGNVTCSLYAHPGNVTFYWTTRNASANHSWSSGGVSHATVECGGGLIELLCWGENEVGKQRIPCRRRMCGGGNYKTYHSDIVFIISFTVIILLIISWIIMRKFLAFRGSSQEQSRIIKEGSCSQMINNCVKSTSTPSESECLATLLTAEQKKEALLEFTLSKNLLEPKIALRNKSNDRTRRIRSSQF